jgi:hypothetical protein
MVNLNEFVQIHEKSIDNETCDFLVNFFEENLGYSEPITETETGYVKSELDLTAFRTVSEDIGRIQNQLIQIVHAHRDLYYELFDSNLFPDSHAFEHFKIQKFEPSDEEHFYTSVDIKDYSSARRFLCFTWFLNENTAGQYEFLDLFIQPEKGKVIIYPPFWMFPTKKFVPIKEPQYTLKTYLHYK